MINRTGKEVLAVLAAIGNSTMLATAPQATPGEARTDDGILDHGLTFRPPLGNPRPDGRRRFRDWLRTLADKSGVYVIRQNGSGEILYAGESHTDRLKDTITRHFREWNDSAERIHFTFDPAAVTVATVRTAPDAALAKQNLFIRQLKPTLNTQGTGEPADAPATEPDPF